MRAMTNEIVYLFDEDDESTLRNRTNSNKYLCKKVMAGSSQVDPKAPHSPAFYTSSDLFENTSFHIISSKDQSCTSSNKQEKSGETSTASELPQSQLTNLHMSKVKSAYNP